MDQQPLSQVHGPRLSPFLQSLPIQPSISTIMPMLLCHAGLQLDMESTPLLGLALAPVRQLQIVEVGPGHAEDLNALVPVSNVFSFLLLVFHQMSNLFSLLPLQQLDIKCARIQQQPLLHHVSSLVTIAWQAVHAPSSQMHQLEPSLLRLLERSVQVLLEAFPAYVPALVHAEVALLHLVTALHQLPVQISPVLLLAATKAAS